MKRVYVVGTADTKGEELAFLSDRIAEAVALRDLSCVFPWCTRPARKLKPDEHPCDCDHVIPYRDDGTGTFAITGGTGAYRTAHGWMDLASTTTPDGGQTFIYQERFHVLR